MQTPKIESENLRRFTDNSFSLNPMRKIMNPSAADIERGRKRRAVDIIAEARELGREIMEYPWDGEEYAPNRQPRQ